MSSTPITTSPNPEAVRAEDPDAVAPGGGPPPGRRPGRGPRLAALGILALAIAVVVVPFFPGHLSNDILWMTQQAISGQVSDHHTPILIWAWHQVWPLGVGVGWLLVMQVTAVVLGAFWLLRAALAPVWAALATLLIVVSPPVYGMLGWVLRDVWFTGGLLLTFGALARAVRSDGRAADAWLVGAGVVCWLAIATRQNAAVSMVVACTIIAGMLLARRAVLPGFLGRLPRALVAVAAGIVLTGAMLATQQIAIRAINPAKAHIEAYLYLYDLAALSARSGTNLIPASVMPERDPAVVQRFYSPDDVVPLLFLQDSPVEPDFDAAETADLRDAWIDAVRDDPVGYLDMRTDLYGRQVGLTRSPIWIYHPGIDPNTLGLAREFPALNDVATGYVETFADRNLYGTTPLHLPWIYLAVCLAGAVVLLRRTVAPGLRVVGALALAALLYQVGLYFLAMGVQYRFQLPVVITAMISAVAMGALLAARLRAGGAAPAPAPDREVTA